MEATLCTNNGIAFLSFPVPDRGVPNDANWAMRFATEVAEKRQDSRRPLSSRHRSIFGDGGHHIDCQGRRSRGSTIGNRKGERLADP
jgi:hypothetical protein